MTGIHDIDKTVEDIQTCLKPGGLVILMCADIQIYDEDRVSAVKIPDIEKEGPDSKGSWFHKVIWGTRNCYLYPLYNFYLLLSVLFILLTYVSTSFIETSQGNRISGASWDRSAELVDLGLWNDPKSDPETAASGSLYLPIGPWATVSDRAQSELLGYAGTLMRQVLLNIHRAYHSSLLKHGMDQAVIDEWSEKIEDGANFSSCLPVSLFILCSLLCVSLASILILLGNDH